MVGVLWVYIYKIKRTKLSCSATCFVVTLFNYSSSSSVMFLSSLPDFSLSAPANDLTTNVKSHQTRLPDKLLGPLRQCSAPSAFSRGVAGNSWDANWSMGGVLDFVFAG